MSSFFVEVSTELGTPRWNSTALYRTFPPPRKKAMLLTPSIVAENSMRFNSVSADHLFIAWPVGDIVDRI